VPVAKGSPIPRLGSVGMRGAPASLTCERDVFEYFDNLLNSNGISQGRFTVLMLLLRRSDVPINPADIAERAGVTRATMTGLIDVLERDGFVKREPSPRRPTDDVRAYYGSRNEVP